MKYGKVKKELHEKKGMVLPNGAKQGMDEDKNKESPFFTTSHDTKSVDILSTL